MPTAYAPYDLPLAAAFFFFAAHGAHWAARARAAFFAEAMIDGLPCLRRRVR